MIIVKQKFNLLFHYFLANLKEGEMFMARKGYRRITYNDRVQIEKMLKNGEAFQSIANKIGCCELTILKEFARGRLPDNTYSAIEAQKKISI